MWKTSSLLALFALAVACSSGGGSSEENSTDDELRSGAICGGIAGIRCPSGKVCKLTATHPDASGRCVTPRPGELGGLCGGIAGILCKAGLECDMEDDSSGPPPGAVGMIVPPSDAGPTDPAFALRDAAADPSSGPPPGAVGMPMFPDQSGKCVSSHRFPPGAMGMPMRVP